MKVGTFKILRQKNYLRIFIIFAVSKNLLFESQTKSTILNLNI